MTPIVDLEQAVTRALGAVAEFHRDREEPPLRYLFENIAGSADVGTQATREAFQDALAIAERGLAASTDDVLIAVEPELRRYALAYDSAPSVEPILAAAPRTRVLAYALLSRSLYRLVCDLSRYLVAGLPDDSRVLTVCAPLRTRFTPKDFLLPIAEDITLQDGWIRYGAHELHVHPALRRGFLNGVNTQLLSQLRDQAERGLRVGVAIDHYRVAPAGTLQPLIELDHWFGRPHSPRALDDPNAIGAALFARTRSIGPMDEDKPGLLTEVWWTYADGLKTVVIEELPNPDLVAKSSRPAICRFVHSIRDVKTRKFIHLDGAITVYTQERYTVRFAQAMNHLLEKVWSDSKVKVFRVDADANSAIAEDEWAAIIKQFYRGNELVLEYLAGKSFFDLYREEYGHDYPDFDRARAECERQ